jgi:mannose-6-phosphate isomerase-like protein (cupin superfamily)
MIETYDQLASRRVVTGHTAGGRSTVLSDGPTPARSASPSVMKCDMVRVEAVPTTSDAGDGLAAGVLRDPPDQGLVHRVVAFPPDSSWDVAAGFGASSGSEGIPGMHVTQTVDLVTVISGELVCILDEGEVTLGPGDTLLQNGTAHAWRNRLHVPAVAVSVMIARRP